jgi:hypothetical protein
MNKVKKVFVLLLVTVLVSLGLMGCKKKASEPPADEPPNSEQPVEHPTEHPK